MEETFSYGQRKGKGVGVGDVKKRQDENKINYSV